MTREDVARQVAGMISSRLKLTDHKRAPLVLDESPMLVLLSTREAVEKMYPRSNYDKDHDYRFGPADVLELEREMRRRLRV